MSNIYFCVSLKARDIEECADMIMVKPGLPYLDLISLSKKQFPNHPMFVYQVSNIYIID